MGRRRGWKRAQPDFIKRSISLDIDTVSLIVDLLGFAATIVIFFLTSLGSRRATEEQTRRECVRATLTEFADLRRTYQDFEKKMMSEDRSEILMNYLSDLERFATGCNMKAYAVDVVNEMSGGKLVKQYQTYFRDFITGRRRNASLTAKVTPGRMYIEYEDMMTRLQLDPFLL